jgi:hypothetical protein
MSCDNEYTRFYFTITATNLSIVSQVTAFAESVLLATHNGIDKEVALNAMLNTVIASPALKYRGSV